MMCNIYVDIYNLELVLIKTFMLGWISNEYNHLYNVIEWPGRSVLITTWAMFPQSRQYPSVQMMMHLV